VVAGAAAVAGAFAAAAAAAGFALACRNAGVGMTPVWFRCTSAMRKKIPAIIAQTPSSMMPSIPLERSPLEMSQMMPQSAIRMKNMQIKVISSALPLGDIPNSLPAAVAVIE
jgi:hypothetical protein